MSTTAKKKEIVWEKSEKSESYSCKGYNTIKHSKEINKYRVPYTWYNIFGEEVKDEEHFNTLEEAQKFSSLFPKGEKVELYEVFYRVRTNGLKI